MQEFYQLFTPVDQDVPYTHLRARSCLCAVKEYRRSCVKVWKLSCKLDISLNTLAMRLRSFVEEFCDGAANLVAKNEELAKTRRVTRHDHNIYVSLVKCLLRKLASRSGVFRSTRDEGRNFFACT